MKHKIYYYIDSDGEIMEDFYDNDELDKKRKEFGNYFETRKEAEKAQKKVKKLLKNL